MKGKFKSKSETQKKAIKTSYANTNRRKWNRAHEFSVRKATKSTDKHPAYIYGKSGIVYKYLAFTHSKTTNGKKNEKLKKNIDKDDERDCYMRTTPLISKRSDFDKPNKKYELRTEYDKQLIKKYGK